MHVFICCTVANATVIARNLKTCFMINEVIALLKIPTLSHFNRNDASLVIPTCN